MGMMNSGIAGFLNGTVEGLDRVRERRRQDELDKRQAQKDALAAKFTQLQMDIAQQNQAMQGAKLAQLDKQRKADSYLYQHPQAVGGMMASSGDNWARGFGGGPDLTAASPEAYKWAAEYQTPEQKLQDAMDLYGAKKQIDSMYPGEQKLTGVMGNLKQMFPNATSEQILKMAVDQRKAGAVQVNMGGKPVPTEKTRQIALSEAGKKAADAAEKLLFNPDGGVDRSTIAALRAPLDVAASGVFGPSASAAYTAVREAVASKMRLESGAVISDKEIDEAMGQYIPGVFDTPSVAKEKLAKLKRVLDRYQQLGEQGMGIKPQEGTKSPSVDLIYNPQTGEFE